LTETATINPARGVTAEPEERIKTMTLSYKVQAAMKKHLNKLGIDDANTELIEREMIKVSIMERKELIKLIEVKQAAIRILRIQQSACLTALERINK